MKQNPKQQNKKPTTNNNIHEQKTSKSEVITSIYQESTQPHQPPQVFGIQSKKNKASITELLRCTTTELGDETDYPDLSNKQRKGRLPPAKATKSSLIVAKCFLNPQANYAKQCDQSRAVYTNVDSKFVLGRREKRRPST